MQDHVEIDHLTKYDAFRVKRPGYTLGARGFFFSLGATEFSGEASPLASEKTSGIQGNQAMNLEIWFKIHTNISNFEMASPKSIINS